MTRVGLILTGESERGGLAQALGRGFPGATFGLVPGIHQGFTCRQVPAAFTPEKAPQLVEVLINTLLGAVTDRNDRFDFAIVVDDLEVENWGRAPDVVAHVRSAARHIVARETAKSAQILRERCSFHLLHPMLEALFFADPNALTMAGAPLSASILRAPGDPEHFTATDPAYLNAAEEPKRSRKKGVRRWAVGDRVHKPKHYLIYLSEQPGGTPYHETGSPRGGSRPCEGSPGHKFSLKPPSAALRALSSKMSPACSTAPTPTPAPVPKRRGLPSHRRCGTFDYPPLRPLLSNAPVKVEAPGATAKTARPSS